jgi:hypothetical protein
MQHVRPGQNVAATRGAMSDAEGGLAQVAAQPIAVPAGVAPMPGSVEAVSRVAQSTLSIHAVR